MVPTNESQKFVEAALVCSVLELANSSGRAVADISVKATSENPRDTSVASLESVAVIGVKVPSRDFTKVKRTISTR